VVLVSDRSRGFEAIPVVRQVREVREHGPDRVTGRGDMSSHREVSFGRGDRSWGAD
jgi:hypothetical protein